MKKRRSKPRIQNRANKKQLAEIATKSNNKNKNVFTYKYEQKTVNLYNFLDYFAKKQKKKTTTLFYQ